MARSRRSQYRVNSGLESLEVGLVLRRHARVKARLVDLTVNGAAVAIPVAAARTHEITEDSELRLALKPFGHEAFEVASVVRHCREENGEQIVGLSIVDWQRMHRALPPKLFALFNRRGAFRMQLAETPGTRVSLTLIDSGRTTSATLIDISATGCGLLVDNAEVPDIDDEVRLNFQLPRENFAFDLIGVVKRHGDRGDAKICGVAFDESKSKSFDAQQDRIVSAVLEQQRGMLQKESLHAQVGR